MEELSERTTYEGQVYEEASKKKEKRKILGELKEKCKPKKPVESKKPAVITLSVFYGALFLLGLLFFATSWAFKFDFLSFLRGKYGRGWGVTWLTDWIRENNRELSYREVEEVTETISGVFIWLFVLTPSYLWYLTSHVATKKGSKALLIVFGLLLTLGFCVAAYGTCDVFPKYGEEEDNLFALLPIIIVAAIVVYLIGYFWFCKGLGNGAYIFIGVAAPLLGIALLAFLVAWYVLMMAWGLLKGVKEVVMPAVKDSEVGRAFMRGYNGDTTPQTRYSVVEDGYERILSYYDYDSYEGLDRYQDDIGHYWYKEKGKDLFFRDNG